MRAWTLPTRLMLAGAVTLAALTPLALGVTVAHAAPGGEQITVAAPGGEQIADYAVVLATEPDGSMQVTETITYDFGGAADRHGIFRTIPVQFATDDPERVREYPISQIRVSSPTGAPDDISVDEGSQVAIRIGDPDRTVGGRQTYVIRYRVGGVTNTLSDHQELYWNAIGDEWEVPIARATVQVTGPAAIDRVACFEGSRGSTRQCRADLRGGTAAYSAQNLEPSRGMTVVASFPSGTFPADVAVYATKQSLARAFTLNPATGAGALGVFGVLAGGALALVGRRGRDEQYLGVTPGLEPPPGMSVQTQRVGLWRRPVVAVQFTPPQGMRPGQLGTLIDERANVIDVTATIVDLAVRGYLTIEEVEEPGLFRGGDWMLRRTTSRSPSDLHPYERELLDRLFASNEQVLLSELKHTFSSDLSRIQSLLYDDVTAAGWFRGRPPTVRGVWMAAGVAVIVVGVGLTWLLAQVLASRWGLVGAATVAAGVVLLAVAPRMPARTPRGTALLAQAKGFRTYLETAEANQLRFEEGEDIFSRYLPFAIVFGVAERWAKVFAQLAASGAAVAVPTWYTGHYYGPGAFDYGGFGRSMDEFSTVTSGSIAAATPSSSGGSGFSGGGFSGGGGGGGGGGSW